MPRPNLSVWAALFTGIALITSAVSTIPYASIVYPYALVIALILELVYTAYERTVLSGLASLMLILAVLPLLGLLTAIATYVPIILLLALIFEFADMVS